MKAVTPPKYFTPDSFKFQGIYFLLKSNKIVYIGQTVNLLNRISSAHPCTGKFNRVRIIYCLRKDLDRYERRWIIKFRPKYNFIHLYTMCGSGRTFKKKINLKPA